jgi:alkylation response protein AidB-like acyl-CoA dehydrogenase
MNTWTCSILSTSSASCLSSTPLSSSSSCLSLLVRYSLSSSRVRFLVRLESGAAAAAAAGSEGGGSSPVELLGAEGTDEDS